jgi:hypothetical protein
VNVDKTTAIIVILCCAGHVLSAAPPSVHRQWRVSEFTFTAADNHEGQPQHVVFGATFTGPDGRVYDVPGFWDGGRTWRLRFTPPTPGVWRYQTEAVERASVRVVTAYDSGTVRGGERPVQVEVPTEGAAEIRLVVSDADDGASYDHADWANAALVGEDGRKTYLDELKPLSASQGHGKLGLRTNVPGQPLRIGDKTFERGLGTHAHSRIAYALPPGCRRFTAEVGVDAVVKEHGTVRFQVCLIYPRDDRVGRRDPGLHGKTGHFTAQPAAGPNPLHTHGGLLRVSKDGHHLTYADGTPFFWLGDTWWFCPSDLMPLEGSTHPSIPSAYQALIEKRGHQRFTVIHMAFLGEIGGVSPFTSGKRGADWDPAYWQRVDRYMDIANDNGLIPVIGMGWTGNPLKAEDWRLLWRHVVARYGAHATTWLVCGEYNVKDAQDRVPRTLALGQYIKDMDPHHRAMSIHPWYHKGDKRQAWEQPWYDFIMFQGGHGAVPPAALYLDAYGREPAKPVLEAECRYEGIHEHRAPEVREAAYEAIQSGSFGYTYGSHGLWYPTQDEKDTRFDNWGTPTPWWEALERPGATHMGHLRAIYESVQWWQLAPAPDAVTVTTERDGMASVETLYSLVDHFPEAAAVNEHWCRLHEENTGKSMLKSIFLHPKVGEPAVLTYPKYDLPRPKANERITLVLALGMNRKANLKDPKNPSDGVTFSVRINGRTQLKEHVHSHGWLYRAVDLSKEAENPMFLELAVEAGPNMNWDHALFRHPIVVRRPTNTPEPLRNVYASKPPRRVVTKADGDNAFVVYFPREERIHGRRLNGLRTGAVYTAAWHDPRTGKRLAANTVRTENNGCLLPLPPDNQDWVLILRRGESVDSR